MHKDLLSKLAQVIEQIPRDVLYDFCCSYAESHEELAMALVNEFWRPEKDDDYFSDLLHYCNIMFDMLTTILMSSYLRTDKDARRLAAIAVVAAGYAGDMDDELANELLDDMDFVNNKVKCRKVELMMPKLKGLVERERESMG